MNNDESSMWAIERLLTSRWVIRHQMKENCHREKHCESEVKTEPTEEIISGNVKCEIDEEGQGSNFSFFVNLDF